VETTDKYFISDNLTEKVEIPTTNPFDKMTFGVAIALYWQKPLAADPKRAS